ncbi:MULTISPECIES: (R)-mandelonitrile lyase [unclassified Xanthobacter]|uniref:(R)-mandelonitrile lyase n=1 Tax=unclassified Xanthobacter TaxID=2623496 RepID=UPI001EDDD615|nr:MULTISPECIES: cupin domain-containing protein [unclassified Xanthobacter]
MKRVLTTALSLMLISAPTAFAQEQTTLSANGERESVAGVVPDNFTGTVTVTPLFAASDLSNAGGGLVEFAPGARTVWHIHPAGQTLIITSGLGWVQEEGGERIHVKAGDVVQFPPNVRHWHGASATNSMAHIAITPTAGGTNVEWLEPVTDADYLN